MAAAGESQTQIDEQHALEALVKSCIADEAHQALFAAIFHLCRIQPDARRALLFAASKLQSVVRGPKAEPAVLHAIRVAGIVVVRFDAAERSPVLTALLHDVLEDSDTKPAELAREFGVVVADQVSILTKPRDVPKPERCQVYQEVLRHASEEVVLVKLADYSDNLELRRGTSRVSKTVQSASTFLSALAARPGLSPRTVRAIDLVKRQLEEVAAGESSTVSS